MAPAPPRSSVVTTPDGSRILCVADVRGDLNLLNNIAAATRASAIIHTGDFGFYDEQSLQVISEKTLRHVVQYSPLITDAVKKQAAQTPIATRLQTIVSPSDLVLSHFPRFLKREVSLNVPVYTVWGSCEDVSVLEKLRAGTYKIHNLTIIDEAHSGLLNIGGIKLRLFGLGGAMVMHRLFDVGEGRTTIAGGQGTMWTTVLQMGELLDTAARVYDPTETRVFVSHASPSREGLLIQLASALKADITISAGLHFRYGSSYNEFSVSPSRSHYLKKLASSRASFDDVWETVQAPVTEAVSSNTKQQRLLQLVLEMIRSMPQSLTEDQDSDDSAFKITWNFNLADAAYGSLILNVVDGRIATEMRSEGFNFGHRTAQPQPGQGATQTTSSQAGTPGPSQPDTSSLQPPNEQPAQPSDLEADDQSAAQAQEPNGQVQQATSPANLGETPTKNGSARPEGKPAPESAPLPAVFVRFAKDPEEAIAILAEEDREQAETYPYGANTVLVFKTPEAMKAAMDRISEDHKGNGQGRPHAAVFRGRFNIGGPAGGANSNWDSDTDRRRSGQRGGRGRGGGGLGRGRGGKQQ